MKNILVLCTGNSCRSQIAHGFLDHFGDSSISVYSAGIETHGVNPRAIQVMAEEGIDLSGHTSNHVDEYMDIKFDFIITVCDHAQENCPYIPGDAIRLHHNFKDPAKAIGTEEEILDEFRKTRAEIKDYCISFLSDIK